MARSAGLTIGQVLTLTFGFLLASVAIFLLGLWAGMAQRNMNQEPQIIRMAVTVPAPQEPDAIGVVTATPTATILAGTPLAPELREETVVRPTPTRTPLPVTTTPRPTRKPPATATARIAQPPQAGAWTVQVLATTDLVQAVVLARQLRAKGYDAFTAEEKLGQVTWYRVRVGRFESSDDAKVMEQRLRRQEQLEAAYVTKQ
jgi:cell division septation protein DedD